MLKIILTFVFERSKVNVVDFRDGLRMVFKHKEIFFNHQKKEKMKLSLEALKERSEAVASTELLATISGGTENACHVTKKTTVEYKADAEAEAAIRMAKQLERFLDWLGF